MDNEENKLDTGHNSQDVKKIIDTLWYRLEVSNVPDDIAFVVYIVKNHMKAHDRKKSWPKLERDINGQQQLMASGYKYLDILNEVECCDSGCKATDTDLISV